MTAPDIEYEFRLGDRVVRGTRIGIGEIADTEAVLNHYPVGATVPVYYNPKDPADALLERAARVHGAKEIGLDRLVPCLGLRREEWPNRTLDARRGDQDVEPAENSPHPIGRCL